MRKERIVPGLTVEMKKNLKTLKDLGESQESRAAAHATLEDDVALHTLITNLFNHMTDSDFAYYWKSPGRPFW